MQQIPVKLSLDQIRALLEMAENQLFRMKFIDSKIPGHKANPEKQRVATSASIACKRHSIGPRVQKPKAYSRS